MSRADAELIELLLVTDLDAVQVAHLTGRTACLVRGCNQALYGEPAERRPCPEYVRGQRLADAWFYAEGVSDL